VTQEEGTRNRRGGILVIAILAAIFFGILTLMLTSEAGGKFPDPKKSPESAFAIPAKLRVRTAQSSQGAVVATLSRGDEVKVIDQQDAWSQVKTSDGITGWVERSSLEGAAEKERKTIRATAIRAMPPIDGVVTHRTALYSGPGIFYPIVGEIDEGSRVKVYTRDHDFLAVERGDEIAFANVDDVDLTEVEGTKVDVASGSAPPVAPPVAEATTEAPEEPPTPSSIGDQSEERHDETGNVYLTVPRGGTDPVVIERVKPAYPLAARRAGTEGSVTIRAVIRKDGSVDDVEVVRDLPNGLSDSAKEAVEQWKFKPATYRGEPIDVYYTVTVNFRLTG
jgi:TonB family protein